MKVVRIGGSASRRRAAQYPPPGDQLGAIAKGFRALQSQGFLLPDETCAWLDQCAAVKASLPKRRP